MSSGPTMQLTSRDFTMLTWLTRFQCATYDQLADVTGSSVDALRHRLPRLEKRGLVVRVDARRGGRPIAWWFPTVDGAAETKTGIRHTPLVQVDAIRATLLTDIALPHHHRGDQFLASTEIVKALEKAALGYAMSAQYPIAAPLPSPDLLIQRGDRLLAVELRFGAAAMDDWYQRLLKYEQLGVHRLLLYTDSVALKALLASPGAYTAQVFVTVHLPGD